MPTLYYFCAPMHLPSGHLAFHVECKLDCSIDDDRGTAEPYLNVNRIFIDGHPVPLLHDPKWFGVAQEIIRQAKEDEDLFAVVAAKEGWRLIGRGGNDPDSEYRRVA